MSRVRRLLESIEVDEEECMREERLASQRCKEEEENISDAETLGDDDSDYEYEEEEEEEDSDDRDFIDDSEVDEDMTKNAMEQLGKIGRTLRTRTI